MKHPASARLSAGRSPLAPIFALASVPLAAVLAVVLAVSPAVATAAPPEREEAEAPAVEATAQTADPEGPPDGAREDTDPEEANPEEAAPAATIADAIVVSAQADEAPRERVGSAVTVIDRAEIEARRAPSVLELLRSVPGVEVSRTGPPGGTASVFLRGTSSTHALVLVDGVRVNSPTLGGFDFAGLAPDNVERIEVLRGPQSTLYGSEALGGVVSIFTRRGTGDPVEGSAAAEVGTEASHRFATSWRGGAGAWDWSLGASHRRFDGVSAASEAAGNSEPDPFRSTSASALLGRDLGLAAGGGGRAELSLRYLDTENGLDGFAFPVGPVDDPNYLQDRRALVASLRVEAPVNERWTQHLRLGTTREETAGEDPDTSFHRFAIDTALTEAVLQADVELLQGGEGEGRARSGGVSSVLSVGGGVERREADSGGNFDETANVVSAFAEHRLAWDDRLFVTAGARHDDHSAFGSETTWRGTAAWVLAPGTRLHGSWGTGFKAPTFNELFFPGFGNPDLRAETSEGWDLGLEATTGSGRLLADLTWYHNDVEDLIAFDFATFRAQNVAAARIRGVEAQLSWLAAPGLETRASWTWTDSEDRATGEPLARRPEHRATLDAFWDPAGRWDAALALSAVADRVDSDGREMEDYQRLDLTVGYRVLGDVTAYVRLDNLLDDDAAEVNGYTTPGRVATVGLRFGIGDR